MRRVTRALAGVLALGTALLLCGCPKTAREGLPNLVVISLDTTRADHLGLYGYFRDTSPRLDAFAEDALVFEQAYTPMATTLPTHASLFTGVLPIEHGVLANLGHGGSRFETTKELTTLAVEARRAGYATGGFVSAAPLKEGSGIEAGFDTFVQPGPGEVLRTGDVTAREALDWLSGRDDAPYLLFVHFFDAHWPFTQPGEGGITFRTDRELDQWIGTRGIAASSDREGVGPEASRDAHNRYDAALRFQDEQLGRLLDALAARPDWDRTSVVIVGDHGEGLSQHGHAAHGRTWNEQLHVPLLLRIPGETPRRIPDLTSIVDVLATLLPRVDAPELGRLLEQTSGRDALGDRTPTRALFAQDTGRVAGRDHYRLALTTPRWKYFRSQRPAAESLYDRLSDPFELKDVAALHPAELERLRAALDLQLEQQRAHAAALRGDAPPPERDVDPELLDQLRSLGYVGDASPTPSAPNVLFVVWDTVRADHLSLYGYERETTPQLDAWATEARVFENAMASASSTVPTHASLFTGLLPSEHGAHAANQWLDDRFDTLAERFSRSGYRTYLWAANPHIGAAKNFAQGFEREEHPWDDERRQAARAIVARKSAAPGTKGGTPSRARRAGATWPLASAGELAADAFEGFLDEVGDEAPWFAFLNYMEAHRPYLPTEQSRRAMLADAAFDRSYTLEATWPQIWSHVFDVARFSDEDVAVMRGMYDASLRDLDDLFAALRDRLARRGALDNTIVVLTADHGELLGEHGLLDHQYSLYEPLVRVPLVVWAPGRIDAGRSDAPVMALDLHATLLELAGIEESDRPNLIAPRDDRVRLAEYPAIFAKPFRALPRAKREQATARFQRRLRAVTSGTHKFIEGEDGRHELYDLSRDPGEQTDLSATAPATQERLQGLLLERVRALAPPPPREDEARGPSGREARLLAELGYAEEPRNAAAAPPAFEAESSWKIAPGEAP